MRNWGMGEEASMNVLDPAGSAETVYAGPFGEWLAQARAALRGDAGVDVPCGDCTGCCTSGYSVQVRQADTRALAVIPAERLLESSFAAGQKTMLARADGSCPMLESGRCSIYSSRPQTCLDYDCRVFAAAGIEAGDATKAVINRRVRAWRFSHATEDEQRMHDAVRDAAAFIQRIGDGSAGVRVPTSPMGIAVLAIKVLEVFLDPAMAGACDRRLGHAVVESARRFDRMPPLLEASH